jgi:RNA polymerase sigma-70 factor (ECF subfamily)
VRDQIPQGEFEPVQKRDKQDTLGPNDLAALYRRHWSEMRRLVYGVVGDAALADDVLQTTFAKAMERGGPDSVDRAKAWLVRVAVNEALAVRRKRNAARRAHQALADLHSGTQGREAPEAPIARAEAVQRIHEALGDLPESQREVVRARLLEGKRFAQIARDMRLPIGTVLTRMRRALERLRVALRDLDS